MPTTTGSRLHKDILADDSGQYFHLLGQPKALMPVGGVPLLDHWIHRFRETRDLVNMSSVYIVTNNVMYPKFIKWSNTVDGFSTANIINDKTTSNDARLGAVRDLQLALDEKASELKGKDVLVVAGDTLFLSDFDLRAFLSRLPSGECGCVYYKLRESSEVSSRGIVELDASSGRVTKLIEKPQPEATSSRFAAPAFYALRSATLPLIKEYLRENEQKGAGDTPGALIGWMVENRGVKLTAAGLSGRFDIADLRQWKDTLNHFSMVLDKHLNQLPPRVVSRVCARIGVMGNPSDGFYGQTLSLSISNFFAEVTVRPSKRLVLVAHPEFDPCSFSSLEHLFSHTKQNGYYGGIRLLKATCRKFFGMARAAGLTLRGNFTMSYSTTIPRMVGLAGSSAIITAAMKGLMSFYGVTLADLGVPKPLFPQRILDVEMGELGINAGLQDRVIQAYGGLVHMDFNQETMESKGHGIYTQLDATKLPTMYLAWNTTMAGDSGKVHSDVRKRWLGGERGLVDGMKAVGALAQKARDAIEAGKPELLGDLMNTNFAMRRKMYGDAVVGSRNIKLAELATQQGMAAKFSGSGGAVVCLRMQRTSSGGQGKQAATADPFAFSPEEEAKIRLLFISQGYEFARIRVNDEASEPVVGSALKKSTSYFNVQKSPGRKSGFVLQID